MDIEHGSTGVPAALRDAVGRRVVVRYRLGDGPQRTDVLGTLRSIEPDGTLVVVADRDGTIRRLPPGSVVAGKPVPPRAVRGGPSR